MSGIHMALMAGAGTSILAGANGGTTGYADATFVDTCGTLLPADSVINGAQIKAIFHTGGSTLGIQLDGARAQDFFTDLVVNGQRLATSAASYSAIADRTIWSWSGGAFTDGVLYPFSYTP